MNKFFVLLITLFAFGLFFGCTSPDTFIINNVKVSKIIDVNDFNGVVGQIPFFNVDGNALTLSDGFDFNSDTNTLSVENVNTSNLVPYSGATSDVDLGANSLLQTNFEMSNDGTNQNFDLTSGDFVFNADVDLGDNDLTVGSLSTLLLDFTQESAGQGDPYGLGFSDVGRRFSLISEQGNYNQYLQFGDAGALDYTIFGIGSSIDGGTTKRQSFIIKQDGSVGFGEADPEEFVHFTNGGTGTRLKIENTGSYTSNVRFKNTQGEYSFGVDDIGDFFIYDYSLSSYKFKIKKTTGNIEALNDNQRLIQGAGNDYSQYFDGTNQNFELDSGDFLFSGGNVGIGTTNPTEKLEVDGNVLITELAGTGNAYVCVDSTGKLYRSTTACS